MASWSERVSGSNRSVEIMVIRLPVAQSLVRSAAAPMSPCLGPSACLPPVPIDALAAPAPPKRRSSQIGRPCRVRCASPRECLLAPAATFSDRPAQNNTLYLYPCVRCALAESRVADSVPTSLLRLGSVHREHARRLLLRHHKSPPSHWRSVSRLWPRSYPV